MPTYVCEECEETFDSREAYEAHGHDAAGSGGRLPDVSVREILAWFTLRKIGVLLGVVLMSTLFIGSAFFYSSLSPSNGDGGKRPARRETVPPSGRTISGPGDVPDVPVSAFPQKPVTGTRLPHDVQVALLTGQATGSPAVLLQYSCDCPDIRASLERIAGEYNSPGTAW
ncbi:MAG: hypothetical protein ABEK12_02550, partial [Candidatus Nanohaloarchaea archaeon]